MHIFFEILEKRTHFSTFDEKNEHDQVLQFKKSFMIDIFFTQAKLHFAYKSKSMTDKATRKN